MCVCVRWFLYDNVSVFVGLLNIISLYHHNLCTLKLWVLSYPLYCSMVAIASIVIISYINLFIHASASVQYRYSMVSCPGPKWHFDVEHQVFAAYPKLTGRTWLCPICYEVVVPFGKRTWKEKTLSIDVLRFENCDFQLPLFSQRVIMSRFLLPADIHMSPW